MDGEEIFERSTDFDRNVLPMIAGAVSFCMFSILDLPDTETSVSRLKDMLLAATSDSPIDENSTICQAIRKLQNFPGIIWKSEIEEEASRTINFPDAVSIDIQSVVSVYNGQIWVRWATPDAETIRNCTDIKNLIYIGMILVEEILHIGQQLGFGDMNRQLYFDFNTDKTIILPVPEKMQAPEKLLLQNILENDIYNFFTKYFTSEEVDKLRWFRERRASTVDRIHLYREPEELVLDIGRYLLLTDS